MKKLKQVTGIEGRANLKTMKKGFLLSWLSHIFSISIYLYYFKEQKSI